MPTTLVYLAAWPGLLVIAVLNGTLRDQGYGPHLSELAAHQLSTLTLLLAFTATLAFLQRLRPLESARQAALIGALWCALTAMFEFGFFHGVMKHPWPELLANYNVARGRVWILVLIWTAIAPWVAYRMRR